ncbi:MAG: kelch repeat-containing protein, partial [bacterium]
GSPSAGLFGTATVTGAQFDWSAGGLTFQPGQAYTFTITGLVGDVCAATLVSNTALVNGSWACAATTAQGNVSHTVAVPAVALAASQTLAPAVPGRGGEVRYRIVVANTGVATVTALTVVDTIPTVIPRWTVSTEQPAVFGPPVLTDAAGTGTRFVWSATGLTMGPGVSYTFTVWGTVAPVCAATDVSTTVAASGSSACGAGAGTLNNAAFSLAVPATAFTVAKTQTPAAPTIGGTVTYRVVVTNTGAATIGSLSLVDTVSPVIVSATTGTPSGFLPPSVAQAAGGTRYEWSGPLTWTGKASALTARSDLVAGVVSAKLYAVGGYNGGFLSTVEEYDPGTNSWAGKAAMPTARSDAAAEVV